VKSSVRRKMLRFLNHMCNGTFVNKMTVHYRKFGDVKINFVRQGVEE